MITVANGTNTYNGLSTDTKPLLARNGDLFFEIDTSEYYMFDAESGDWVYVELSSGSGGGGGGKTAGTKIVLTDINWTTGMGVANATAAELRRDLDDGAQLVFALSPDSVDEQRILFYVTQDFGTGLFATASLHNSKEGSIDTYVLSVDLSSEPLETGGSGKEIVYGGKKEPNITPSLMVVPPSTEVEPTPDYAEVTLEVFTVPCTKVFPEETIED